MRRFLALLILTAACSSQAPSPVPSSTAGPDATPPPAPSTSSPTLPAPPPAPQRASPTLVALATSPSPIDVAPVTKFGPRDDWFVVWVTGWMPDGFSEALRAEPRVDVVSEVWVGNAHVVETRDSAGSIVDSTAPGFVFPVEMHAFDAVAHAGFVPDDIAATLLALAFDEVLLGTTSARLRRLSPGATITLEDGTRLTVAGVVADQWVGFAEMVTTSPDAAVLGADRPRYAVVKFGGPRSDLEAAGASLTDRAVRVWAEGEVSVFRHADAVQPQVVIKQRFGGVLVSATRRPEGGDRS